jgi:riboflavin kinase / FMN adenylyltransferase
VSRRIAVPARGVYAGMGRLPDGRPRPAATSVGGNPTFGGQELRVETHLLDFDGDLYGEHLRVRFLKKLRDEQKYDGLPALQAAIARDARQAKEYFLHHG